MNEITKEDIKQIVRNEIRRNELIKRLQKQNRLIAEACSVRNIWDEPNGEDDFNTMKELWQERIEEDLEELKGLN